MNIIHMLIRLNILLITFSYSSLLYAQKKVIDQESPKIKTEFSDQHTQFGKQINSEQEKFIIEVVAENLYRPWSLAFLPNGDMLVTERSGKLRIIKDGKLLPKPVRGLPKITAQGQGGLLDIIIHPNFKHNKLVYFSYVSQNKNGIGTQVASARLYKNRLINRRVIFTARPKTQSRSHFGSRLLFDTKGFLYITLGDKFSRNTAQKLNSHLGSLIRIRDNGATPRNNPFVRKRKARREIFSYGIRNSQGIAIHPKTKKIWFIDHGPQGGDELNILKRGANYGWPAITYGINYNDTIISEKTHAPGMEQPIIQWTPSLAPSGLAFYNGEKFPNWKGDLFVGALAHLHLRRLELDGEKIIGQEILLQDLGERIRDVRSGPDGFLYVLTDSPQGKVLRLIPAKQKG